MRTSSLADLAREAARSFTSRRSFFSEETGLRDMLGRLQRDEEASTQKIMDDLWQQHAPRQIIVPANSGSLAGWFAQLSSAFDPELGAVTLEFDDAIDGKHEIIVHDSNGLVISRRVTRRSTDDRGGRRSP
jgi:hypothetical protein